MKKLRNYLFFMGCLGSLILTFSCSKDYLNVNPKASVTVADLGTETGVNGLLIGAYKGLSWSVTGEYGGYSNGQSAYADNLSDDRSTGTYNTLPTSGNSHWVYLYNQVQRCNDVLRVLAMAREHKTISDVNAVQVEAEAKFLRGVYYLFLAGTWLNVPWVDETISFSNNNYYVTNTESIWPKIEADFQFAADNLTPTKSQVGRANSWAAKAYLAKTYIWQVKYTQAKPLLEDIIANGRTVNNLKYALNVSYWNNFNTVGKHGSEVVFALQNEVNTGAYGGNAGDMYNGPYGGPASPCCGWLTPAEDLADAFQTDAVTGLPLLNGAYKLTPIKNDQGLKSNAAFTPYAGTLDPRLDWCIGRRGIPYLDWGVHPGYAWIRFQNTEGPYSAKKNMASQARVNAERQNAQTTNAYNMIRFAEVLLWAAECEVEIGSLATAEGYVNLVRGRAANPGNWVYKYLDDTKPMGGFSTTPAANYKVGLYTGQFTANGKSYAREAVWFERRLEFALEHHRWYDLERYNKIIPGYMGNTLNAFLAERKARPGVTTSYAVPYEFIIGKHEIRPIPQAQIDVSLVNGAPTLVQNPGY